MRLKTFTAANMAAAMQQVRTQMGEDAVIIANHTDRSSGEVTLTVGFDESMAEVAEPVQVAASGQHQAATAFQAKTSEPTTSVDPDTILDALSDLLEQHGCPRRLCHKLLADIPDTADSTAQALHGILQANYRFLPHWQQDLSRKMLFVGLPGAGKTVSIAKMATQLVLDNQPVALISLDTAKAGGLAQLSELADTLNTPMHHLDDMAAIPPLLAKLPQTAYVLIDMPGLDHNGQDAEHMLALRNIQKLSSLALILVLDSSMEARLAADIAKRYGQNLSLDMLLPTKLDLIPRLGTVLAAANASDAPLGLAGIGQDIAHGLAPLSQNSLSQRIFAGGSNEI